MANEKIGKAILNSFAYYNKNANMKMNKIIETISEEEWDKQFSTFWKSIRGLCSHNFSSDRGWFNAFMNFANSKTVNNEYFNMDDGWNEIIFKNINEYIKMRRELDNIIIDFIKEITNEDLERIMDLTDSEGKIVSSKCCTWILHIFNHATHTRAQISLLLDMIGKENDFSGFDDRENIIE